MVNAETYWSPTGTDAAHTSTGRWRPRTRTADTGPTPSPLRFLDDILGRPAEERGFLLVPVG